MYYLELIKRFWDFNYENNVGSTATAFYLYLLKEGFASERYDFKLSDVKISRELRLTRKTVKSTKEKLEVLGLIAFQTRNGLPCHYRILLNYPLRPNSEVEVKPLEIEDFADRQTLRLEANLVAFEQNVDIPTIPEDSQVGENLDFPNSQRRIKNLDIPNFDEFLQYAQTLEFYESTLEKILKEKYENWLNEGWINHSKRPITNWKSSLKSVLPFLKDKNVLPDNPSIESVPTIRRPKSS
ncbi:hypothetical protein [Chryseobacterium sp. JAH]|uniref:hypothetical protein n=1 Tax=Chryseobacterium sp. JAH TaxID=1742858 RepID=UPI000741000E|nr:hypothetical protein [Chryseobacterium sp. JAH]KUJ50013.1 hypothetical protein AR685_16620 [Chryseobacterium sp. JAH]